MYRLERVVPIITNSTNKFAPFWYYTVTENGEQIGNVSKLEIILDTEEHPVPIVKIHQFCIMEDGSKAIVVEQLKCTDLSFTAELFEPAKVVPEASGGHS